MNRRTQIVSALTASLLVLWTALSCSNGAQPPASSGEVEVQAPIDSVAIVVAESFPPQYFVEVTSGLPNGCVRFNRYEVKRRSELVQVIVTNLAPAGGGLICTQVYGTVRHNIGLGSDFVSGKTYLVAVNDVAKAFTAQ